MEQAKASATNSDDASVLGATGIVDEYRLRWGRP
jgi:hypothetical protein